MRKGNLTGKIFGIALVLVMIGAMVALGGFASQSQILVGAVPVEASDRNVEGLTNTGVHWTGQCAFGEGTPFFDAAQDMCDAITTASGGQLELELVPGGAVCAATKEFGAVDSGSLDFAVTGPAYWQDRFGHVAALFSQRVGGMLPAEKYCWYVSGDGGDLAQEMTSSYRVHFVPGAGVLSPAEIFLHSNCQINHASDLQRLKIRTSGDSGAVLARMGASILYMPGSAIRNAMQRGVIHAFEYSTPCVNWDMAFQEIADYVYVSECRAPHDFCALIVNSDRWDELDADLKRIVEEEGSIATLDQYGENQEANENCLGYFEDYGGCDVQDLPQEVEDAFLEEASDYYDEEAAGDAFYQEVLESLRSFTTDGRKGDFDGDDDIDIYDFVMFAAAYGSELGDDNYNPVGDFDDDGDIDIFDFVNLAAAYGT